MANAKQIGKELREFAQLQTIRYFLLAHTYVRNSTPVRTGWAKSNWILSFGTPFLGTVGSRDNVNNQAQRRSRDRIRNYKFSKGPIFLTNNVPYLVFLNEGSSTQAPARFIQSAFARAERDAK